jgi:hypothetical protein
MTINILAFYTPRPSKIGMFGIQIYIPSGSSAAKPEDDFSLIYKAEAVSKNNTLYLGGYSYNQHVNM